MSPLPSAATATVVPKKTAHAHDHVFARDGRRVYERIEPAALPNKFSGVWLYAGEAAWIAHHQSLAVGCLDEDGSAEAANPSAAFVSAKAIGAAGDVHIGVVDFPNGFSSALVERNQVRLWVGPAVDINEIAMNDGRGSSAPIQN